MQLWTDIIDPATLTGYARASQEEYERRKGNLAAFLPNRNTRGMHVRFRKGQTGLVAEAQFRAYDAEPEVGKRPAGQRVTLELPAIGLTEPVSEYDQLRLRGADNDSIEAEIFRTTDRVVRGISDRMERLRGTVLTTGKATIDQANFNVEDDFGRHASMTLTASTLWSGSADKLADLQAWVDLYIERNGVEPGAILTSNRVFRNLQADPVFATTLVGGATRRATESDVRGIIEGAGLPPITKYDRRTSAGRVIPDDRLLLLPAPVDPNSEEAELGGTFWGETLSQVEPDWGLEGEEPGIVAGVYKNPKPPMIAEVISDAIGMPVLANADLSLCAKVL